MRAGSVLVIDGGLWHGGGANTTADEWRIGVNVQYCAGFCRPQQNQYLGIPREITRTFSDRLLELCGYSLYKGMMGHIDGSSPAVVLGDGRLEQRAYAPRARPAQRNTEGGDLAHRAEVAPASVGMDAAVLDALVAEFERTLEQGKLFHGAQIAVYRRGMRILDAGGGLARVRTHVPVAPDTLFVLFSATKGLAGLAMLMLYERGKFHYDEPVAKYWPEFTSAVPEKRPVTIRHVLSHRAGFPLGPRWLDVEHWGDRAAIRRAMIEIPLRFTPGERNAYHAMNYGHMVNELVSRIDGRDCGRSCARRCSRRSGSAICYLGPARRRRARGARGLVLPRDRAERRARYGCRGAERGARAARSSTRPSSTRSARSRRCSAHPRAGARFQPARHPSRRAAGRRRHRRGARSRRLYAVLAQGGSGAAWRSCAPTASPKPPRPRTATATSTARSAFRCAGASASTWACTAAAARFAPSGTAAPAGRSASPTPTASSPSRSSPTAS